MLESGFDLIREHKGISSTEVNARQFGVGNESFAMLALGHTGALTAAAACQL